ncbi:HNH endonuclease [Rhodococcus pyridinivorans]|uniref:HNH endonuclease n=1 Tax=Rhodococcus pyridinivorans TaxID=103816 RepID=UPI00280B47DB|nr:HNH endonuclease [Rhodococcus pyridinivorans]WMM73015.1 HNH endonuclease [Rhodococcus pyridinivorans]
MPKPTTPRTATTRWKKLRTRLIHTRPHTCHHCGRTLNPNAKRGEAGAIELDHLEPFSRRPDLAHDPANLVLSCQPCNLTKSGKAYGDPIHAPTHTLPLPTSQDW